MVIKFSGVEKNVDETWVLILKQSRHESDNRKPLNNGLLRWETRVKCSGSALVSCDMMYHEGLVSSYLVPISLSLVSECNMRTPSPRVALCLPYLRLMSGIISAHVSRCRVLRLACFCLNKSPGFWHLLNARKDEAKLPGLTKYARAMFWYKHLLCQIKSLPVAKGYYIVKC